MIYINFIIKILNHRFKKYDYFSTIQFITKKVTLHMLHLFILFGQELMDMQHIYIIWLDLENKYIHTETSIQKRDTKSAQRCTKRMNLKCWRYSVITLSATNSKYIKCLKSEELTMLVNTPLDPNIRWKSIVYYVEILWISHFI